MDFEKYKAGESTLIHEDVVAFVGGKMPDEEPIYEVSELFRAFGDSTRARMICALSISELCVGDLAALLSVTQSAISHQLRMLKQSRLVRSRRDGKVIYYSLADEHIRTLFAIAFEHVMEE